MLYFRIVYYTLNTNITSPALGGVAVWEQKVASGEQCPQAGAADNQDTAGAGCPGDGYWKNVLS